MKYKLESALFSMELEPVKSRTFWGREEESLNVTVTSHGFAAKAVMAVNSAELTEFFRQLRCLSEQRDESADLNDGEGSERLSFFRSTRGHVLVDGELSKQIEGYRQALQFENRIEQKELVRFVKTLPE
ncbi:MAG: hypothetical protein IKS32_13780 [Solobacterium sp.]|nr:hypothetical protein [Solobacterium sp.]